MERIGNATGVEPVTLPEYDRDPAYLEAARLDELAGYAERLADALAKGVRLEPAAPDDSASVASTALLAELNALDKDAVTARAEAAGMTRTSRTTKAEAVDFLLAAEGVSEAEQAALAGGDFEEEAPEAPENGI